MLLELLEGVDTNKNYEKSDLLQILRILKNYDLLKAPQLELFALRKRRARRNAAAPVGKGTGSTCNADKVVAGIVWDTCRGRQ